MTVGWSGQHGAGWPLPLAPEVPGVRCRTPWQIDSWSQMTDPRIVSIHARNRDDSNGPAAARV